MRSGRAEGGIISPALFSLYAKDMRLSSGHFELDLYMNDTAVIATSCLTALLLKYLETYLSDLERGLSEWTIVINVSKRSAVLFAKAGGLTPTPRPVQLFIEPIQWVDTARYLRVTIENNFPGRHIDHVRKKAVHRLGTLGLLLNCRSNLSIRNGVLLYKQLISPMMDYAFHVWRPAARSHMRKMPVIHSKCLRVATINPCYICKKKFTMIWELLLYRPYHITEILDSKLVGLGYTLVLQLGRYLAGQALNRFPQSK